VQKDGAEDGMKLDEGEEDGMTLEEGEEVANVFASIPPADSDVLLPGECEYWAPKMAETATGTAMANKQVINSNALVRFCLYHGDNGWAATGLLRPTLPVCAGGCWLHCLPCLQQWQWQWQLQ